MDPCRPGPAGYCPRAGLRLIRPSVPNPRTRAGTRGSVGAPDSTSTTIRRARMAMTGTRSLRRSPGGATLAFGDTAINRALVPLSLYAR